MIRSGFIGIVGPTNAGKSTLMNALVGQKISIVSPKCQTTYHGMRAIKHAPSTQKIFIDTPGYQRNRERVAQLLNVVADKHAKEADLLLWVFDASSPSVLRQIEGLSKKISQMGEPSHHYCVLNKVDQIDKLKLLPMIEKITQFKLFQEVIPLSALKNKNVDSLEKILDAHLPSETAFFPEDMITDRPKQFLVTERVREKIYHATRQELPYSVIVEVERWEEPNDLEGKKMPVIYVTIHVDSQSKKGILIGKGGEKLKKIGTEARKEIETLFGQQVCLKLFVSVMEGWKRNSRKVEEYLELK